MRSMLCLDGAMQGRRIQMYRVSLINDHECERGV